MVDYNERMVERLHDKSLEPPEPGVLPYIRCAFCDEPIEEGVQRYVTGNDLHLHEEDCFHEYACTELGARLVES